MHAARWVAARWGDFGLMWRCLSSLAHVMGGLPWRCAGRRCLEVSGGGSVGQVRFVRGGPVWACGSNIVPSGAALAGADVVNARVGEDIVGLL